MGSKTKDAGKATETREFEAWKKSVKSVLKDKKRCPVKELRKLVLLSMQMNDDEKPAKKQFKSVMKKLESERVVTIDSDGTVKYLKKRKRQNGNSANDGDGDNRTDKNGKFKVARHDGNIQGGTTESRGSAEENDNSNNNRQIKKNKPCTGNPQGITRLFLGNLPFAVDENSLAAFLPGTVTHIKWITDSDTGRFYGSAFVEMKTSKDAADAVAAAGTQLMGRPIKINFAPARNGDVWPPAQSVITGNSGTTRQAGGSGKTAMSPKPDNCVKLFVGNISFELEDDQLHKFFGAVGAEIKAIRWLHHKDTGDFKGCGYVEFWDTQACDKAAGLNGKHLLNRPIRIDWAE